LEYPGYRNNDPKDLFPSAYREKTEEKIHGGDSPQARHRYGMALELDGWG
jgi:hypothetical protein